MIHHYTQNKEGRDYVCGDIHGCYDDLMGLLQQINFNFDHDRLFTVGDLIDRGPKSYEVLELLSEKWFYSTLGNHEMLMLGASVDPDTISIGDQYTRSYMYDVWMNNGGKWCTQLSHTQRNHMPFLLRKVERLPLTLTIDVGDKKVALIHAQITEPSWDNFIDNLVKYVPNNNVLETNANELVQEMLWSRNKVRSTSGDYDFPIDGIDHIFHGHAILPEIKSIHNCTYIDTGGFLKHWRHEGDGKLTIIDIAKFLNDPTSGVSFTEYND